MQEISQLAEKIEQMSRRNYEVANAVREKTRQIETLTKRLAQCEKQKQTKAVYQKHRQLELKKHSAYKEKHAEEIRLYKETADYFKAVMNGRTELPIKKWKKEFIDLAAEKYALCDEYYRLDDELRKVEVLKRTAMQMMGEVAPEHTVVIDKTLKI